MYNKCPVIFIKSDRTVPPSVCCRTVPFDQYFTSGHREKEKLKKVWKETLISRLCQFDDRLLFSWNNGQLSWHNFKEGGPNCFFQQTRISWHWDRIRKRKRTLCYPTWQSPILAAWALLVPSFSMRGMRQATHFVSQSSARPKWNQNFIDKQTFRKDWSRTYSG